MQNKFGYHMCKDVSGENSKHIQVYVETTVENIGTSNYTADTGQKTTKFDLKTERVEDLQ